MSVEFYPGDGVRRDVEDLKDLKVFVIQLVVKTATEPI
ncbi:unnamed protein product, partial [marine sediment metagenome]